MKRVIFTLLAFLGGFFVSQAQIVITEISYNNPSFDDYEFLELYNNSPASVDLSGWSFAQGIVYTFPTGVSIGAGGYLVLSIDSVAFLNTFGVASRQWTSNSLSNSGEDIILVDGGGTGIDTVDYDDFNPWPRIADGLGPSLILCDVNADNNDVANWSFSPTPTGVIHGESMLFASPGAANATCPTSPTIFFVDVQMTESEGVGSVDFDLVMANTGPTDTANVDVVLDVSSTATAGTDFTFSTTQVDFGSDGQGGFTFQTVSIPITDDMDLEPDETIVLSLSNPTMGAVIAATGNLTITITDNELPLPLYDINLITDDADGDGLPDSLNVMCRVQGIVHGIDLQGGSSIQFTIIDSTGGIGLFSSNDFGYTVQEGDEVLVEGEVDEFNGLAQMSPDTIIVVSTGNPTVTPVVVTTLDESTENELVTLECVSLVDPNDWPSTPGGSVNIDVTDGVNTYTVRIDSDTDLNGSPTPTASQLNITGIGGQFDSSFPHNSGYQLLPRYLADIEEKPDTSTSVNFDATALTANEGDGTVNVSISLANGGSDTVAVDVSLDASSTATLGADFVWMDTTIVFPANATNPIMLGLGLVDDMDVESDESIVLTLSNPTNGAVLGDSVLTITIEDNDIVIPAYPIDLITDDSDGDGLADSLGVLCQVQGIVHGIDLQGSSNVLFVTIDSTGGISTFSTNDFGYTVTEGDEVIIQGTVVHFNGLAQMSPDTIILVSSGNPTVSPLVVTALDESTENELVSLLCVTLLDTAQWPNPAGGSANMDVSNGVDTFTVRIDSDTDLNGAPVPQAKWLNITGLGGQFDSSDPRTSGYQLLPRYMADVVERPDPSVGFTVDSTGVIESGGSVDVVLAQADGNPDTTFVQLGIGGNSTAQQGIDFSWNDTTIALVGCGPDTVSLPIAIIDDEELEGNETLVVVIFQVSNFASIVIDTLSITIEDDATDAIEGLLPAGAIRLFPNPVQNQLQLESDYRMQSIQILTLQGQELLRMQPSGVETQFSVSHLAQGMYLIRVQTREGSWISRWIKQ